MQENRRCGVFICHCGGNISGTIDIEKLKSFATELQNVVIVKDARFLCSEEGQGIIKDAIAAHALSRIVVATCSPKFHEATFRRTLQEAGLNPFLLSIANVREQCSFPHSKEKEKAQKKAERLLEAAVQRALNLEQIKMKRHLLCKDVLVIGGGIAGIQAALDLAGSGHKVYLVERAPSIGGNMARLVKTFPTDDCAMCTLSPKMNEVSVHKDIELFTYAEIKEVSGIVGAFDVKVLKKARFVDERRCVGCGECMEKCPQKVDNEFDCMIGKRAAIYIPFANALPKVATIDKEHCLFLQKGKCQICKKVCPADAINFEQKDEYLTIRVGAIIVATGYKELDPSIKTGYGYGRYKNVITQLQLARMIDPSGPTAGRVICPTTGEEPKRILMIQCVGSRDVQIGRNYCSRICCMAALKHANLIKRDILPHSHITICYMDMRAFGKGYEDYYKRVQELGVEFIRGRPGEVDELEDGRLLVKVENTLSGRLLIKEVDLVVLSAATIPAEGTEEIAKILGLQLDEYGFIKEYHPKLRPIDTSREGVFVAGAAQGPKDIQDTVAQAKGAAAACTALLSQGFMLVSLDKAEVNLQECKGCRVCERVCPFDAVQVIPLPEGARAVVTEALCQGCGICASSCPTGAMQIRHFKDTQILAEVSALSKG